MRTLAYIVAALLWAAQVVFWGVFIAIGFAIGQSVWGFFETRHHTKRLAKEKQAITTCC